MQYSTALVYTQGDAATYDMSYFVPYIYEKSVIPISRSVNDVFLQGKAEKLSRVTF